MRAGDPVEEQQPVEVVDLVLEGPGLERVGGELERLAGARDARRARTSRVARFTSPVRSGTDRQPSRPRSHRVAWTTTGFARTSGPWQVRALGWPVTSRENTRGADADLRRGEADAAGRGPLGRQQVGGQRHDVRVRAGRPRPTTAGQHAGWRAHRGADLTLRQRREAGSRRGHSTSGSSTLQRHLDPEVGADRRAGHG